MVTSPSVVEQYIKERYSKQGVECADKGRNFVRITVPPTVKSFTRLCEDLSEAFGAVIAPDSDAFGTYLVHLDVPAVAAESNETPVIVATSPNAVTVALQAIVSTLIIVCAIIYLSNKWSVLIAADGKPEL